LRNGKHAPHITFMHLKKAKNYKNMYINANDRLGRIEIYDATYQGLNKDFGATAFLNDKTVLPLSDCKYDKNSDRLIWPGDRDLFLAEILEI